MLINGERINAPFRREIVFPRVEKDIVFTAKAVSTTKDFERLCPAPEPKIERDSKGEFIRVVIDDPVYKKKLDERHTRKLDYQVIKCLEGVEWETVDIEDPNTWENWKNEAIEIGLSDVEIMTLIGKVLETLQPSEELIEESRQSFLASRGPSKDIGSPSQSSEQENI